MILEMWADQRKQKIQCDILQASVFFVFESTYSCQIWNFGKLSAKKFGKCVYICAFLPQRAVKTML